MPDIIQTLRATYTENPAAALYLLPELFQQYGEGLIKVLPCKVGDTVYTTYISGSGLTREIVSLHFSIRMLNDIGKTVFLTRPEAEKALKERETQ
ncbi:hypothetical protein [Caproiciproducens sp.]